MTVLGNANLSTATDGRTAWRFSSPKKTAVEHIVVNADNSMPSLEQAVAQLPFDIGAKKAAQLLRERHPDLAFNTKDLREALGAAKASPSTKSNWIAWHCRYGTLRSRSESDKVARHRLPHYRTLMCSLGAQGSHQKQILAPQ